MKVDSTPRQGSRRLHSRLALAALTALAALLALSACGEKKKERLDTTAAAKVNREEITLAQINQMLLQQRNLRPEQADAASRQILEFLIDQELVVKRSEELKLDREPRVLLQLEAARREVLARAHADKVADAAPKPTPEDVHKYYDDKPARFKERRVYTLQEMVLDAKPEQVNELRGVLASASGPGPVVDYLKLNNIRFQVSQVTRASDQLPQASLDVLAKMTEGQVRLVAGPTGGAQLVALLGSQAAPVTEEQARPAIEQIVLAERRRKLIEDDLKQMRSAAKIEYLGKFAEGKEGKAAQAASAASGGS